MRPGKEIRNKLLASAAALLVWQAAAFAVRLEVLLPSPLSVLQTFVRMLFTAAFWKTAAFSLLRIAGGFFAALLLGFLLALAAHRFPWAEMLLWPYVITVKTVPVASVIIICLIWLGSGTLPMFISFLAVFPLIYTNLLQGLKSTDGKLLEMAGLFRVPWLRRLRFLYLPQIEPYLRSACSVALGMAWKSGVAAEVIAVTTGSMGEELYMSKVHYLTPELFAWTLAIVLLSVAMEKTVMRLLDASFRRLKGR